MPGWLILVNRHGRRFANESAPYTVLGRLIEREGGSAYAIFDETARAGAKPNPTSQAYWVNDVLKQKADAGRIIRAQSVTELAAQTQLDPVTLQGTLERYNSDVDTGHDPVFFKTQGLAPIRTAPFYAVEVRPAIVCWTGTGLRIDADGCVLSQSERPIPGLYAAGETVGNLHGDVYVGGGGSFGPCIVFGKQAGERAAKFAKASNA